MRRLVRVVKGVWHRPARNEWVFHPHPSDVGFGVMIDENEAYTDLETIIKTRFEIPQYDPIALTYEYPRSSSIAERRSHPPIDIETNAHVALFMAVRNNHPGLPMYLTSSAPAVAIYHYMCTANFQQAPPGYSGLGYGVQSGNGPPQGYAAPQARNGGAPQRPDGNTRRPVRYISDARILATERLLEAMFTADQMGTINRVHLEQDRDDSFNPQFEDEGNYHPNDVVIVIDADDETLDGALIPDDGIVPQNITINPNTVIGSNGAEASTYGGRLTPTNPNHLVIDTVNNGSTSITAGQTSGDLVLVGHPVRVGPGIQEPGSPSHDSSHSNGIFQPGSSAVTPGIIVRSQPRNSEANYASDSSDDVMIITSISQGTEIARFNGEIGPDIMTQESESRPPIEEVTPDVTPREITEVGNVDMQNDAIDAENIIDNNSVIEAGNNVIGNVGLGNANGRANEGQSNGNIQPGNIGTSIATLAYGNMDSRRHPSQHVLSNTSGTGGNLGVGGNVSEGGEPSVQLGSAHRNAVTSEEDDEAVGPMVYSPSCLSVGMQFKDRAAFKWHVAMYAITHKFTFKTLRSKPARMDLRCIGVSCSWRVYAVRMEEAEYYEIRKTNLQHTCTVDERSNYQRQATTSILGKLLRQQYLGDGRGPTPKEIRNVMRTEHDVNISYWKAWYAREVAMDNARGNAGISFKILPSYLQQLVDANPGSLVDLNTVQLDGGYERFQYLFFAFNASIKGYPYMRKVIVVDGTHLKGKYGGCLLTASAQDGDYSIFPLAFGIVDSENDQSWEWFLKHLSAFVLPTDDLVFVSDRHASIYVALTKVYPNAVHCACVVHLKRNIKTNFKNRVLGYLVHRAAYAYTVAEFNRIFSEIQLIDQNCANYLIEIGFAHWARSYCAGFRYDIMTSNIAESWNSAIRDARELPIKPLVEYIRGKLMNWFRKRRDKANAITEPITGKVQCILSTNFESSAGYEVMKINEKEYEVRDKTGVSFYVNLATKCCSCCKFQMLCIPCCHAVGAAVKANIPVHTLVGIEFSATHLQAAYSSSVNPVTNISREEELANAIRILNLFPPATKRPPGRPRKKRFLSRGEHQLRGIRRRVVCSRCKGMGHNKATCKMPI